jgi:hypothetical protein
MGGEVCREGKGLMKMQAIGSQPSMRRVSVPHFCLALLGVLASIEGI